MSLFGFFGRRAPRRGSHPKSRQVRLCVETLEARLAPSGSGGLTDPWHNPSGGSTGSSYTAPATTTTTPTVSH
jgi:hypothetical protein